MVANFTGWASSTNGTLRLRSVFSSPLADGDPRMCRQGLKEGRRTLLQVSSCYLVRIGIKVQAGSRRSKSNLSEIYQSSFFNESFQTSLQVQTDPP